MFRQFRPSGYYLLEFGAVFDYFLQGNVRADGRDRILTFCKCLIFKVVMIFYCQLPKLDVGGSNPLARFMEIKSRAFTPAELLVVAI
jgi:hypothetical protein